MNADKLRPRDEATARSSFCIEMGTRTPTIGVFAISPNYADLINTLAEKLKQLINLQSR